MLDVCTGDCYRQCLQAPTLVVCAGSCSELQASHVCCIFTMLLKACPAALQRSTVCVDSASMAAHLLDGQGDGSLLLHDQRTADSINTAILVACTEMHTARGSTTTVTCTAGCRRLFAWWLADSTIRAQLGTVHRQNPHVLDNCWYHSMCTAQAGSSTS